MEHSEESITNKQNEPSVPYFSIVTPAWNRARDIGRCVESVLNQTFTDFEHIIVDDASTDNTAEIVAGYTDTRVRILKHDLNKGVCAARNTGTKNARAGWIVSLDSDWTLDPDALQKLYEITQTVDDDVGVIGGMIRTDTGQIWPGAIPPDEPMGYIDFLKWIEACSLGGATDFQPCRRKDVFNSCPWPTERVLESRIHFDIAMKWKVYIVNDIIATQYLSEANSISRTRSWATFRNRMADAKVRYLYEVETEREYGKDMKMYTPALYKGKLFSAGYWSFLAGKRLLGLRYLLRLISVSPFVMGNYVLMFSGLIGPHFLCWMNYLRSKITAK